MSGIQARSTFGKLEDNINFGKDLRKEQFITGQPIGSSRRALDTIPMGVYLVSDDIVEAGSNNNLVNLTAHGAKKGDVLRINTTANNIQEFEVAIDEIVSPNSLRLGAVLSADLSAGDTVSILRPITQRMSSDGATLATITESPISFVRDGVPTEVSEDTGNSANTVGLPVKIVSAGGDITITAGDINVQLTDQGANADATRIGDGVNRLGITASGEAQVADALVLAKLVQLLTQLTAINANTDGLEALATTLNGKDFATQTTLALMKTALDTLNGKDFATQTTLSALLTELQLKADLSETQPVSAASLPLPSGASTSALQTSGNASLTTLAAKDFATQTTLALMKTALDSLLTGEGALADAAVTNPASNASVIAALKGILSLLANVNTKLDTIDLNTSPALNSVSNNTTVTNTLISAPASAVGMIIQNSTNSDSAIRFTSSGVTPSSTVGFFLGPGQSTSYMPAGNVRTISVDGGAIDVAVIWFV